MYKAFGLNSICSFHRANTQEPLCRSLWYNPAPTVPCRVMVKVSEVQQNPPVKVTYFDASYFDRGEKLGTHAEDGQDGGIPPDS